MARFSLLMILVLLAGCSQTQVSRQCSFWESVGAFFHSDDDPPALWEQVQQEQDLRTKHCDKK